ncbi:Hypothetical predicted protein [Cloeon dipterum]|uniref:Uncharacterized protein n=1 Tax=Cloeon dipterum TaxID=197152 RepID=A0A8S1C9C7_9INSE|nr:Hypothetical predicted protein [Cloeon dipterum]
MWPPSVHLRCPKCPDGRQEPEERRDTVLKLANGELNYLNFIPCVGGRKHPLRMDGVLTDTEYCTLFLLVVLPVHLFFSLWAWMGWELFTNN